MNREAAVVHKALDGARRASTAIFSSRRTGSFTRAVELADEWERVVFRRAIAIVPATSGEADVDASLIVGPRLT